MQDVAIFWDYENCPPPSNASGYTIANNIRLMAQAYGSVKSLKAYLEITNQVSSARALALRSELQTSGVSLIDCPHNGRKEVADKMIIVDMLAYAIDNPAPSVIVLISGDRDFAYALSILRLRQYQVILVTLSNAHPSLTSQASKCIDWHSTIINPDIQPPSRTIDNPVGSVSRTASYHDGLPGQSSTSQPFPSPFSPSQSSPSQLLPSPFSPFQFSSSQSSPSQSSPSQSSPSQLLPSQPLPSQSSPSQPLPSQSSPSQSPRSQPLPSQSSPSQSSPSQPLPSQPLPSQSSPSQSSLSQPLLSQSSPSQPLASQSSPSQASSSQFSPFQSLQYTQETENIERADHGDLLHYLRASTSARPKRLSDVPSFRVGQQARYESPRQDASPAIEVELGYTPSLPNLVSKSTTDSMDSSVSISSPPAVRAISDPVPKQDSTLAPGSKDAAADAADHQVSFFWSSTNEQVFPTSLPKTDKSTVPTLLPSIMQETPQHSPVAQYAVLEADIPDDDSTSCLPSIYSIRPASAPHSLPSQSPLVPLISVIGPLASETATILPEFPDAEALPTLLDSNTTNQQHIHTLPEDPGKPVSLVDDPTSPSDASIALSEEICSNPELDPPDIDYTYRPSSPVANSNNQFSVATLPNQPSPSIVGLQNTINRLPPITPITSYISQASPSIVGLQNTVDRLPPITPTMFSLNQVGTVALNVQKIIDKPSSILSSAIPNSSKPKVVIPPMFRIFVDTLKVEQAKGNSRPRRSLVADTMYKKGFTYDNINVSNFSQYTALAEKQGIVELGNDKTGAWISLKPEYQHAPPAPPPAPVVAPIFKILVETLKVEESRWIPRPLQSDIAIAISRDGLTYKEAGVERFSQYASLAEKEGIIELGGRAGHAWISLKPEYLNAPTA